MIITFHDSEFESSSRGFEILRAKGMKRKSGDSNIRKNLGISFPGKNGFPKAEKGSGEVANLSRIFEEKESVERGG